MVLHHLCRKGALINQRLCRETLRQGAEEMAKIGVALGRCLWL